MAFEILLNNPMTEPKLLDLLVSETRKNYDLHQNTYYFFKLKNRSNKISEIIWLKTFDNRKKFTDFFYDTKFFRAAIMLKFKNDHYEVMCQGFKYFDVFEVTPNKIFNSRPLETNFEDYEGAPMPSRELIEKGFGEITEAVVKSKSHIPV